jgi:predicted nucleic acid-binding protein
MSADRLYFDSCYLVRFYIEDQGFEEVRAMADRARTIVSAWHAQAEIISAVHRICRNRKIDQSAFLAVLEQFSSDCTEGLFEWLPLTASVQRRLETAYMNAPQSTFPRAADALHLACAAENGFSEVYSNDGHLLAAAPLFGLKGVDLIRG